MIDSARTKFSLEGLARPSLRFQHADRAILADDQGQHAIGSGRGAGDFKQIDRLGENSGHP